MAAGGRWTSASFFIDLKEDGVEGANKKAPDTLGAEGSNFFKAKVILRSS